jgi:hypothetical protein
MTTPQRPRSITGAIFNSIGCCHHLPLVGANAEHVDAITASADTKNKLRSIIGVCIQEE